MLKALEGDTCHQTDQGHRSAGSYLPSDCTKGWLRPPAWLGQNPCCTPQEGARAEEEPGPCLQGVIADGPWGQQRRVGGARAENLTLLRRRGSLRAHPDPGGDCSGVHGKEGPALSAMPGASPGQGAAECGTCSSGRRLGGDGVTVMLETRSQGPRAEGHRERGGGADGRRSKCRQWPRRKERLRSPGSQGMTISRGPGRWDARYGSADPGHTRTGSARPEGGAWRCGDGEGGLPAGQAGGHGSRGACGSPQAHGARQRRRRHAQA